MDGLDCGGVKEFIGIRATLYIVLDPGLPLDRLKVAIEV
jgi:hypothetical protein